MMSDYEYVDGEDEAFNIKALRLTSGKEIITDARFDSTANVYVLEFPLSVVVEADEMGQPRLGLTRYILAGDYDRTMFLTPNNVETIAGVSATMKEKYLDARAEYFNMIEDEPSNDEIFEGYEDMDYEEPTFH